MKNLITMLTVVVCIFIGSIASSKEYASAVQPYKDNYFLFGDMEHQIKLQLSLAYNLIYPTETGLYLGYTQMSNWFVYKERDTFLTNYQPELLYRFESGKNIFNDYVIPFVDYIQVSPFYHCSTGIEGVDHRSMNQYYGQVQLSYGDIFNFGINGRFHRYWSISNDNPDINSYRLNYEAGVFLKLRSMTVKYLDKEEIRARCSGNPAGRGYYILEAKTRIITTYFQPKFMIQYQKGYSDIFVNYNKKEETIRFGISIE